jgi:hypothetical protein
MHDGDTFARQQSGTTQPLTQDSSEIYRDITPTIWALFGDGEHLPTFAIRGTLRHLPS